MSAPDPWHFLRQHTDARVALGRTGNGLPTEEVLTFQLAHAQARDAVYAELDDDLLKNQMVEAGISLPIRSVSSQARGRAMFLQRPDLGRLVDDGGDLPETLQCDVVFVLADGLSALALHQNGVATLAAALSHLASWQVGPVIIAHQARVALADPIGHRIGASFSVVLIGERPGLSAADSLGAYLTYAPRPGRQNAERNCISNIRAGGLSPEEAGHKIAYLLTQAQALGATGIALKDDSTNLIGTDAPAS